MKKIFGLFIALLISVSLLKADEIRVGTISSGFQTVQNPDWGGDVLISTEEPLGKMTGVARPNGEVFVAVPDTTTVPGFCLLIYRSTNFGDNWVRIPGAITSSSIVTKTKMLLSGADSVYCLFQIDSTLFYWNIENNNFNVHGLDVIRDFDAATTSSAVIYVAADVLGTNQIRRHATLNGGATFSQTGLITLAGAHPKTSSSASGDTVIINYYGPVLPDTATSIIRSAIYRETSPGIFASSNFIDVAPSGIVKTEFLTVVGFGIAALIYTQGTTGNIDIRGYLSNNGGVNYPTPFGIATNPNVDEYWVDAKIYTGFGAGIDVAYYSDSLGGTPSNTTDQILYTSSTLSNPTTFSTPVRISYYYPQWSPNDYGTNVVEFYDANADVGVFWVGVDGASRNLYWNRLNQLTGITNNSNEIPASYELSQNYPNPFNPETKINFSIPVSGYVSLKVFDMLGREVALLVNGEISAGSYTLDFNANKLSSGPYIYRLEAAPSGQSNGFTGVKRMMLIK